MELRELIKPGNSIQIYFNENNPNNRLIHIRAIVDERYVVFRTWSKHKQDWMYEIHPIIHFEVLQKENCLKL